jgi:hypothetical protein
MWVKRHNGNSGLLRVFFLITYITSETTMLKLTTSLAILSVVLLLSTGILADEDDGVTVLTIKVASSQPL